MRCIKLFLMMYAGLMAGFAIALVGNTRPATWAMLAWGFSGAIFLGVIQIVVIQLSNKGKAKPGFSAKSSDSIRRAESQGSFLERMKRFAQNVDAVPGNSASRPKLEFWVDPDLTEYEVTPPKPNGIIRFLLHRIRRVLSGR